VCIADAVGCCWHAVLVVYYIDALLNGLRWEKCVSRKGRHEADRHRVQGRIIQTESCVCSSSGSGT